MLKKRDDYYAHADQRVSMMFDKHAKAHRTEYEHGPPHFLQVKHRKVAGKTPKGGIISPSRSASI
jgi:hypothetical protein